MYCAAIPFAIWTGEIGTKVRALYEKRSIILESELSSDGNKYLVISDLHIGFEEKFRGSGARIKPDIETMLADLDSIVDDYKITEVIVNGDVKSGIDRILESEWEYVPRFFSHILRKCRVRVIPGNHDGGLSNLLPENVVLDDVNGALLEDSLILHGHTRPLVKFSNCKRLIVGHAHPLFKKKSSPLSGKPVWAFLKVPRKAVFREMIEDNHVNSLVEVVVMPSFNLELSLSGYHPEAELESKKESSLISALKSAEEAVIVTLQGEVIGDMDILANVL